MKVPDVVLNVYRDLRDRRMLSIAIVLIVAIIAVPFLLGGGGGEEAVPPPSTAITQAPFEGSEQLDPVVLAEAPGLRDFRQRLADYRSHNPFRVKLSEKERRALRGLNAGNGNGNGGGGAGAGSGASTDTVPTDTGATDTAPVPIDTGATDTTVPSDTNATDTPPADTGATDTSDDSGSGSGGTQLISYRIDVRVGPVGHTKVQQDVSQLDFLPDRHDPLVQFIDADVRGSKVAFIVNPMATAVKGDAQCVRSMKDCQYLVMERKDEMYFRFGDQQYRLQLMSINEHREPYEPDASSGDSDGGASAGRGLSVFGG